MELSLFDMHCDTAYEIYKSQTSIISNNFAVSIDKAEKYKKYCQVFAIWSDCRIGDNEAFEQFKNIYNYYNKNIKPIFSTDSRCSILAVEDSRILAGDISRLDYLYSCGVRILTPVWSGESCIGGAFDTDIGLTEFGKDVVKRCFEFGIIVDISHSSRKTAAQVFELNVNNKPVIASHSDAFCVHPHPRNLTDEEFLNIKKTSGLVGINLYCEHLGVSADDNNSQDKIIEHIEHYLSLGGENNVCFGCDFDGAETPNNLKDISNLDIIANRLSMLGYNETLISKLFSKNAECFINKNFNIV